MYALAWSGVCGCELQDWAEKVTLPEFLVMVALSAGMGAVAGALVLVAPIAAPILGGIGAGISVTDMIKHGVNLCNVVALVASVGGGLAGTTATVPKPQFNPSMLFSNGTASLFNGWSISVTATAITVVPADVAGVAATPLVLAFAGGGGGGQSEYDSGNPRHPDRQNRAATVTNKQGEHYPDVIDPRTGKQIPFPDNPQKTPVANRAPWDIETSKAVRNQYIRWWVEQGFPKIADWKKVQLHHIQPREFGGTNDLWNLVPLEVPHHTLFTNWWAHYP